jgi:hypothetical protein
MDRTIPAQAENLTTLLDRLIAEDPALGERLAGANRVTRVSGWPLPTYSPAAPLVNDRVLLVGDAAGLINPLNGEGIQYALLSGRWAAEALLSCAEDGNFSRFALTRYADRLHGSLRYEMALSSLIVRLTRNRSLNPVWIHTLRAILLRARADPRYADATGGILAGMQPSSAALQPRVLLGTARQAAFSLGVGAVKHAIRGPGHLLRVGAEAAGSGVSMAAETARHPMEVARWGADVALGAAELGSQIALHLVPRKATGPSRPVGEVKGDGPPEPQIRIR